MPFNFETFGTPVKETKAVKTAEKKTEPVKKVAGKFDFDSFGAEATPEAQPEKSGGIKGFAKSLVSAPLTIAARPFQLGAELLGASSEDVNRVSKKISGGFIAPVPENFKDVKKDVGRAVQTVAMGAAGPVSAGAGLGFGASLEQGNDVLSMDTLKQTAGGAVAGKVLGVASKPIGKVLDKVTPNIVKKGFSAVTKPVTDFAERTKIMPEVASNVINNGARMTENALNKPFDVVGGAVKGAFTSSPEKIVQKRANTLQRLEDSNTRVRNYVDKQRSKGFDPKKDAYTTDLLVDSVDNNGVIRTKQENGAVARYNEAIRDKEGVVGEAIKREGRSVPLKDVEKELITAVNNSGVKGASRTEALSKVSREIEGYKMELDPTGTKTIDEIDMPVFNVHGAKVDKYANVNYLNENGRVDKAIAKTLKKIVEKNTASVDVAALNREMSGHYANIGYLEKLDGTRVEGGRLGKHFARTVGAIVGSHFGPLGAIAGSELAGGIKGLEMSGTFGKSLGKEVVDSPLMQKTIASQKFTPVKVKSVGGTNNIPIEKPGFRKLPVKEIPSDYTDRFYKPDSKLPVIDAGKTPKVKSDLPVAEGNPKVFAEPQSKSFGKRNAIQPKVTNASKTPIDKSISQIDPELAIEAHGAPNFDIYKNIAKRMNPDMPDSEIKRVWDVISERNKNPVLKSLEEYKLASSNTKEAGEELLASLSKDSATAKKIADKSRELIQSQKIKKLYRYGDEDGISWTTTPDKYFENGRPLQEIEVTPDVLKRVVYAEGAEIKTGLSPQFSNTGEGEVMLMPKKSGFGKSAAPKTEVRIAQYTDKGKEGKFWTTPEGADSGFGGVKKTAYVDTSKLFKDSSSYSFLEKRGLMTDSLKRELELSLDSDNPNRYYEITQKKAEEILKKEGYPGAYWTDEDDLNPTQYQIWERSIINKKRSNFGK